jgi:NTE family protein
VLEWTIRRAWRARVALATVGSNPTLSASSYNELDHIYIKMMRFFKRLNPDIGIALGSGAARGLAHIGVLKALTEANIHADLVAGTSMGALVGACYAKSGDISEVEGTALRTDWRLMARLLDPSLYALKKGLISGKRVEKLLYSLLGDMEFKDLKIPLHVVATDVKTGHEVIINEGKVVSAVRASISIPGIFVPVIVQGRCLVDGGTTNPVPINIIKEKNAKTTIAVNVLVDPNKRKMIGPLPKNDTSGIPNIFDTLIQSIYIMEYEIIKRKILDADIIINPDVGHIQAFEFHKSKEAIKIGYEAAQKEIKKLQDLIAARN